GHVTFGCFNRFSKVRPETMRVWAEILRAVPRSRLLMHCRAGGHRIRVQELFAAEGIERERVEFIDYQRELQYLQNYGRIDIAMDTYPYNGGTTSCDGLWMGVPLVTLCGGTAVGRGGVSILSNIGMSELIARTAEQY